MERKLSPKLPMDTLTVLVYEGGIAPVDVLGRALEPETAFALGRVFEYVFPTDVLFELMLEFVGGSFDWKLLILNAVPFVFGTALPGGRLPFATFTGLDGTVLGVAFTEGIV